MFFILLAGLFVYLSFSERFDMLIERFTDVSEEMDKNSDMLGRAAILYAYVDYMNANPLYYLTGAMKEFDFQLVPHNMFFTSIYYNGILPLLLLAFSVWGFWKELKLYNCKIIC